MADAVADSIEFLCLYVNRDVYYGMKDIHIYTYIHIRVRRLRRDCREMRCYSGQGNAISSKTFYGLLGIIKVLRGIRNCRMNSTLISFVSH